MSSIPKYHAHIKIA